MIVYVVETLVLTSIKYLYTLKIFHDWAKDYNGFYTLCYGLFLIWAIISIFFAFFFCTFLHTIRTGFFRWFQRNPPFLNPRKTDQDMSHFVRPPTAFQIYSSFGIKLQNPKFNAQKGINCFQTLLHSLGYQHCCNAVLVLGGKLLYHLGHFQSAPIISKSLVHFLAFISLAQTHSLASATGSSARGF